MYVNFFDQDRVWTSECVHGRTCRFWRAAALAYKPRQLRVGASARGAMELIQCRHVGVVDAFMLSALLCREELNALTVDAFELALLALGCLGRLLRQGHSCLHSRF